MTLATDFIAQLTNALRLSGTDGTLTRADDPGAPPLPVRFLLDHPTRRDEAIVNAYGVNALVLTFAATAAFVAAPPKKFDLIKVKGEKPYALEAVLMRQVLNTPVAFTAYVRGKAE